MKPGERSNEIIKYWKKKEEVEEEKERDRIFWRRWNRYYNRK